MLTAGFHKVCISPPVGAPLAGFAARQGMCEGVHDDLFVRALVLENDGQALAFVSADLLALPREFVSRVRAAVATRTGIGPEALMVASTHTHAGPVTISTFFNPSETVDAAYMERLAAAIEESVAVAWQSRFAARVGVGVGRVSGVGVNRRTPDRRPVDEEIGIIKVEDRDGRPRGVLINYSCHPTVLGPNNLLATGDFPAFAVARLEAALGHGGFALFVNGTQGNISMGHSSELSAIGVITPGRTFERAGELGSLLAEATLKALPEIETGESLALGAAAVTVKLPLKELPSVEAAAAALEGATRRLAALSEEEGPGEELRRAMSDRLYASITQFYAGQARALPGGRLPMELQGLRLGGAVFVAVPAEVFVEIGLELKRRAHHRTFIVGLANGYIGYLPTREAYAAGGYEVVSAQCAPESAALLVESALELEGRLF